MQHEHLPGSIGQPPDRFFEIQRQLGGVGTARHAVQRILGVVVTAALGAERGPPGQDDVHSEAMQPRPERRLCAKRRELGPRPDEHILREIVRVLVPGHPPGEAVDPGNVRAVQPLEGPAVPRGGERHVGCFRVPRRLVVIPAQCRYPGSGELHVPDSIWLRRERL